MSSIIHVILRGLDAGEKGERMGNFQGRLQVSGKGGAGDLVQIFQKKWWIKSDFTVRQPPSPFSVVV